MAASTFAAVWCWEFEGVWTPYGPVTSNAVEIAHRNLQATPAASPQSLFSTEHIVDLGKTSPDLLVYEVDLKAGVQRNKASGFQRQVERRLCSANSALGMGVDWQFQGKQSWQSYAIEAADELEKAHSRGQGKVDLSKTRLAIPFTVDLSKMRQANINTGYKRKIRRQIFTTPYVTVAPGKLGRPIPPSMASAMSAATPATAASTSMSVSTATGSAQKPKSTSTSAASAASSNGDGGCRLGALAPLCSLVTDIPEDCTDDCPICMGALLEGSSYADETQPSATASAAATVSPSGQATADIVRLKKCQHAMHRLCLEQMQKVNQSSTGLACPVCKTIHGIRTGTQPQGTMMVMNDDRHHCAGHPDVGIVIIQYRISSGVQGPEHPNPGQPFSVHGFPRTCFLPRTPEGEKIAKLLRVAWDRRLIFTVGTSSTSGTQNTVTWNEIHHKTEYAGNGSGHGYPDDDYFANVLAELAAQGVTEDDLA